MQKRIVSVTLPLMVGILALALGWFAHAAAPLAAQSIVVGGGGARSAPGGPAAPAGIFEHLTYQGRLANAGGAPVNSAISVTFRIYTDTPTSPIWTSAVRTITPTNGLFTVYLGDGADPDLASGILGQAASIGVTVGGDAEMTPRQPLNTIVGHSDSSTGVVGSSNSNYGVKGFSTSGSGVGGFSSTSNGVFGSSDSGYGMEGFSASGTGVVGNSTSNFGVWGTSAAGYGVVGQTSAISRSGVIAQGAGPAGTALEIINGGIKVDGAGAGSSTPVFVHVTYASNITATSQTIISHPLTDNNANAILIVTPVSNYSNNASVNDAHPIGVMWRNDINKWVIYNTDGGVLLPNTLFNVLVVRP